MDQRDIHSSYLLSSEATAQGTEGTGFAELAGKEDPVDLKGKPARVGVVDG